MHAMSPINTQQHQHEPYTAKNWLANRAAAITRVVIGVFGLGHLFFAPFSKYERQRLWQSLGLIGLGLRQIVWYGPQYNATRKDVNAKELFWDDGHERPSNFWVLFHNNRCSECSTNQIATQPLAQTLPPAAPEGARVQVFVAIAKSELTPEEINQTKNARGRDDLPEKARDCLFPGLIGTNWKAGWPSNVLTIPTQIYLSAMPELGEPLIV